MLEQKENVAVDDNLACDIAFYKSPVGYIKIMATPHFITCLEFMDDEEIDFHTTFSNPLIIEAIEQFIQYFNGQRRVFTFPIEQTGTPFQQKIWNELQHIPFGKTISYLELAVIYGDRKATRAVAGANSKNKIAIVVPCHRVIGAHRELVGYAGGLWRKRWLLEHEKNITHGIQKLF